MGDMLFQDDDKVVQVAMQIVIAAGDARNAAGRALDCVGQFDFAGAKEQMKEAHSHISEAHNADRNDSGRDFRRRNISAKYAV